MRFFTQQHVKILIKLEEGEKKTNKQQKNKNHQHKIQPTKSYSKAGKENHQKLAKQKTS